MKNSILFLRSLIFNMFFFCWSVFVSLSGIPLLMILSGKPLTLIIGRVWAWPIISALRVICGTRYEIRGLDNLPDYPCIIASKHQSAWETMIFYKILKYPTFVLKKELSLIPIYGKYLKEMDSIIIDRQAGASALKDMVRQAKYSLDEKRTVIIFPEGTRIKAGEKGTYHPGVSALYSKCQVPVIPVALNSGKFWAKNSFLKKPGKIVIEFLPAVEPEMRRDQFMQHLEKVIEEKSDELLAA